MVFTIPLLNMRRSLRVMPHYEQERSSGVGHFSPSPWVKSTPPLILFLADDGRPLTEWGVSMLFRKLKQRAPNVDKRISPHTCQHW
ncbi:MAG: hypothetical protein ACXWQ5_23055, partial [Ktedonobacterales bacterium]